MTSLCKVSVFRRGSAIPPAGNQLWTQYLTNGDLLLFNTLKQFFLLSCLDHKVSMQSGLGVFIDRNINVLISQPLGFRVFLVEWK